MDGLSVEIGEEACEPRRNSLKELYLDYYKCDRCPLHKERGYVVFGEGPKNADVIFVGLAPGETEDIMGKAFIGESGKLLRKMLKNADIEETECFFTNIVACRPWELVEKEWGVRKEDRKPTSEEIQSCQFRLHEIIRLVDPVIIVALGKVAASSLLRKKAKITAIRGQIGKTVIHGIDRGITYSVMPTLHPAYILRYPDTHPGGWACKMAEDLERVSKIKREAKKWMR